MIKFEVGETYNVSHSRRGKFIIKVTDIDDEWVTGKFLEGVAETAHSTIAVEGETFTSRISFCHIISKIPASEKRRSANPRAND